MEGLHLICDGCTTQFFSSTAKRCISCALPILNQDTHCSDCLRHSPAFDRTIAVCDYVAPFDQLVLNLKFGHRLAIAKALANLLVSITNPKEIPDLLISVPLSQQRLAQRGFNQALEIAKPLASTFDRPLYTNVLKRIRDTQEQALLQPEQRQKNIKHAFSINDPDKIRGQHIGVVDDVMTTGATLQEIAVCLKKQGAVRVTNIVFARTPPQ